MEDKVLVAYASKYGSTQEVAEAIAKTMREAGMAADLQPARMVRSLVEYGAVVLGAPLYIGHWHKDVQNFLSRHQVALNQKPVAVFTLGPTNNEEKDWQEIRAMLDQEMARYPWLKPAAVELFGGRLDPRVLRFPDSLLASLPASPLHNMPASDVRDWGKIRDWAMKISAEFQPVVNR